MTKKTENTNGNGLKADSKKVTLTWNRPWLNIVLKIKPKNQKKSEYNAQKIKLNNAKLKCQTD